MCALGCKIQKGITTYIVKLFKGVWNQNLTWGVHWWRCMQNVHLLQKHARFLTELSFKNADSWNVMIQANAQCGFDKGVNCYRQMQLEGVPVDTVTSLLCLKACANIRDLETGRGIHGVIIQKALEREHLVDNTLLGNALLDMYIKCGSLFEAQLVFDRLPIRTTISWTSLIAGYTKYGLSDEALDCFRQMQLDNVSANTFTYIYSLKACGAVKALEAGKLIHTHATTQGLENMLYLVSALVNMYSKCGWLVEAYQTLQTLPSQNAVAWTALIAGYAEHGLGEEVLDCFKQMQLEGVAADAFTFALCLKACGSIKALEMGREMHAEIWKSGVEIDLFLGNTLVDMYGKCGENVEAREVFDQLPFRDAVSWNALIVGYSEHGFCEEVNDCVQQMQLEGITPDSVTFVLSTKACATRGSLAWGREIHSEVTKRGLEWDVSLGNTLVDMYVKCGSVIEGQKVFDWLPIRSALSWTALVAGYAEVRFDEQVVNCFKQMQADSVFADASTFVVCLKACGTIRDLEMGQEINAELIRRGFEIDLYLGSALVDMYSKCSSLTEAHQVLERMPVRNAITWTALITGYTDHGLGEEALKCLKRMQIEGLHADSVTFVVCLKNCASILSLETGRELHAEIRKSGLEMDPLVGTMLIDMYGKCGSVAEGCEVFDKLPVKDNLAWTAMIKTYGENHQGARAVQCFQKMQGQGVTPDSVTFTCLLAACSHASLVLSGQEYFKVMREQYRIEPMLDHYACMVDLFARSGYVYEAERLVGSIQCLPSNAMIISLLSSCKKYGKLELGQRCFQQLVEMNEEDASAFLLMADAYANACRWSDANKLDEMRKNAGAKKRPGSALIEVNKILHEFIVGASQSKIILNSTRIARSQMDDEGYIPNLDLALGQVSDKEAKAAKATSSNQSTPSSYEPDYLAADLTRNVLLANVV